MGLFNAIIIAIALAAFGVSIDAIDSADVGLNANLILAETVITSSVCNEGFVDCRNGFEVIDGEPTYRTCQDACGGSSGSCCSDGKGFDACDNFSGLVCKDGSCSAPNGEACGGSCCVDGSRGDACNNFGGLVCKDGSCSNGGNACKDASIERVINSCIGGAACRKAGSNGGSVGYVVDSCQGDMACENAGSDGGSIDSIEDSCKNGVFNCYQLAFGGSIGQIISSCSGTADDPVDKACYNVGQGEPPGDILSCCNGEYEVCCQDSYSCRSNTVTTLPKACASDPTVGIRGFARRFADE